MRVNGDNKTVLAWREVWQWGGNREMDKDETYS